MLEANTTASRNGAALIASRSQTSSVTGAISSTVVTLSSSAEATAVTNDSRIMMRRGDPLARLAAMSSAACSRLTCSTAWPRGTVTLNSPSVM